MLIRALLHARNTIHYGADYTITARKMLARKRLS